MVTMAVGDKTTKYPDKGQCVEMEAASERVRLEK